MLAPELSQVYVFRSRFEEMGIRGGRIGATDNSKGDYVRLMEHVDVSKEAERTRVTQVLEKVLKNLALRVLVDGDVEAASPVADFIEILRARPHMHFVATQQADPR